MNKKTAFAPNEISKRGSDLEPLLHSEHVIRIEKMAVGAAGVARLQFKDKNLVVFVDRSAPGDELKIKITQVEKNYLKAEIVEVLRPSSFRREAPCPYFAECGGCSWQHIIETEQLRQKEVILIELFKKFLPHIDLLLQPSVSSELAFGYRNRIQLKHLGNKLGYFQRESHNIVDIDRCLIADEKISSEILNLKTKLKNSVELRKFELRLNQKNEFESYPIGFKGEGLSFSQVNNSINEKLVSQVSSIVEKSNVSTLTELYSGSGNFTFKLLEKIKNIQIESAELNSNLTKHVANQITSLNLQKRLFAFTADCDFFVKRRPLSKEFILLDPPRAGCSDTVIQKVARAEAKHLVYVSCHPVNLVRDLVALLKINSKYKINFVQIFDMFPQTDHFETLVHLSINDPD